MKGVVVGKGWSETVNVMHICGYNGLITRDKYNNNFGMVFIEMSDE